MDDTPQNEVQKIQKRRVVEVTVEIGGYSSYGEVWAESGTLVWASRAICDLLHYPVKHLAELTQIALDEMEAEVGPTKFEAPVQPDR